MWLPPNYGKDRQLSLEESRALKEHRQKLAQAAEIRQDFCWMRDATGCQNRPHIWVREVFFDSKDDGVPTNFVEVSSKNLQGPVPGFCPTCINHCSLLAERVYFSHPAVYWGVRPRRWFVSFTDGSKQGGPIGVIDPNPKSPHYLADTVREDN